MGAQLGAIFNRLWNEVAWLHVIWGQYVELYGTKPQRIDMLNQAARLFFRITQDALWDATLLGVARLTDPPRTGQKENLTIQQMPELIHDDSVKGKVNAAIDEALEAAEFCRHWRNRHIAHRDLALALSDNAKPLEPASRHKVKLALKALTAVLDVVSLHYIDGPNVFLVDAHPGDAQSLVDVLDDGLKADAERQERLRTGKIRPEDLHPRDL